MECGNLWTDFDYSVFSGPAGTTFHSGLDLPFGGPIASVLSNPATRWGFDNTSPIAGGLGPINSGFGLPIEYVNGTFIGRFTHGETSDLTFGFPGTLAGGAAGNPMQFANPNLTVTNGAVTQYSNGSRRGKTC